MLRSRLRRSSRRVRSEPRLWKAERRERFTERACAHGIPSPPHTDQAVSGPSCRACRSSSSPAFSSRTSASSLDSRSSGDPPAAARFAALIQPVPGALRGRGASSGTIPKLSSRRALISAFIERRLFFAASWTRSFNSWPSRMRTGGSSRVMTHHCPTVGLTSSKNLLASRMPHGGAKESST